MEAKDKYKAYFVPSNNGTNKAVIGCCCDIVKDFLGLTPYEEQVKAATELYKGNIVDQKTGEGKTISILLASLLLLRDKRKVYIVTANEYLSKRDYEYAKPIYDYLGYNAQIISDASRGDSKVYFDADIIYATGENLIFDYLIGIKPDYDFAIIDEIDYTLVECAGTEFSVSKGGHETYVPTSLYKMANEIAKLFVPFYTNDAVKKEDYLFDLQYEYDVIVNILKHTVAITERGFYKLDQIKEGLSMDLVFIEAFLGTLTALYLKEKNVHYIVEDEKIVLINDFSGRKSYNSSLSFSVHTALEVKEGLPVKPKEVLTNSCSYTVFFSFFKDLAGISGTTSFVPFDFATLYGKQTKKIKEHKESRRKDFHEFFKIKGDKYKRIHEIVKDSKTPVLIITKSDAETNEIYDALNKFGVKNKVMKLDNYNLDKEKDYLKEVSDNNITLITSKIVGRGTDITVNERLKYLTVIIASRNPSEREERQAIGRTGRNGHKGVCYIMASLDEEIFKLSNSRKRPKSIANRAIQSLQRKNEGNMFEARKMAFVISKLFLIYSDAIIKRLSQFNTFEEIRRYLKLTEKVSGRLTEKQKKLLIHDYKQIEPWFQMQVKQYISSMGSGLYKDEFFCELLKECVNLCNEAVKETLMVFLEQTK